MINIIYGLSGSGKTRECINIMQKLGRAVYVVPEPLSYTAECTIADHFGGVSPTGIDVTTFKRMFFNTVSETGIGCHTRLSDGGKAIILSYLCKKYRKDFKVLGKSASYKGFAQVAAQLISEFKNYGVTPQILESGTEKCDDKLRMKLEDICLIYREYEKILAGKYTTADDDLGILASLIRDNPELFMDSVYIFDGFSGFIPAEINIISALADCCRDIYITFDCDKLKSRPENTIFTEQLKNIDRLKKASPVSFIRMPEMYKLPEFAYLCRHLAFDDLPITDGDGLIRISSFNNIYGEVTFIAEEILRLVKEKKLRFRDISIIARDSDKYAPVITSVFSDYAIPVFISDKLNATAQPAVYTVLDAMEAVLKNYTYETMFSYLKSGFANLEYSELDLLENYIIATGIRGSSWTNNKPWKYTPSGIGGGDENFLDTINSIREKVIAPLKELSDGLKASPTVKEKAEAVFRFTERISLFEKINAMITRFNTINPSTSAYYGQVWNVFISTLDEIAELLGDTEVTNDEFYEIFVNGLMTHEISVIPTTSDCVHVCGPDDCVSEEIIFVTGANDGTYPQVMSDEGILSDSDRLFLSDAGLTLAQDTVQKAFSEGFVLYNVLTRARSLLYISYPVSTVTGDVLRPARAITKLAKKIRTAAVCDRTLNPDMAGKEKVTAPLPTLSVFAENMRLARSGAEIDPLWYNVGDWFKNSDEWKERYRLFKSGINFSPKTTPIEDTSLLFPYDTVKLSVSRLELYRRCPFAYFATYGLRLSERKPDKLDFTDTGSIMHEIIEQLSVSLDNSGETWKTVSDTFLNTTVNGLIDAKIAEIENMFDNKSSRRHFLLLRLKETLLTSVMYIAEHLRNGKFIPLGYEIEFDDRKKYAPLTFDIGGKTVKLRGKIDRADMYTDSEGNKFIRVIDYKSGDRSFDVTRFYYGLDLQLAVYLDRLCEQEDASPAGFLYFRLHDSLATAKKNPADGYAPEVDADHKLSGLLLHDDNIIDAMDSTLKSLPLTKTSKGEFNKNSLGNLADYDTFKGIRITVNKLVRSLSRELLKGNTDISPINIPKSVNGCSWCDFKDVCHFEEKCGGKYNEPEISEDIFEILKKEGENDA